jgi:hypothetical protein
LKDHLLGRCGTDDLRKPAQVGWPPVSTAHVADIVPEQKGFEPELGRLERAQGIFTGAAQIANRFILNLGNRDGVRSPERSRHAS